MRILVTDGMDKAAMETLRSFGGLAGYPKPTESDALQQPDVGQNVTVKKWNDDGTTQVSYRGALWTAYTAQQSELSVGVWRIVRVEGTRLLIEPASH